MKDVKIGPVGGNQCCTCCGKCSDAGGQSSTLKTCPSHCCPCPPTGNVCVQFADLDGHGLCPNLMASCITLGPAVATGTGPPYTYTDVYTSLCPGGGSGPQRDVRPMNMEIYATRELVSLPTLLTNGVRSRQTHARQEFVMESL